MMDIRQQKKVVLVFAFLVSFLLLIVFTDKNMVPSLTKEMSLKNDQLYVDNNNVQRFSSKRKGKIKKLPDVIIVGVKKSGTITLKDFLNYHPYIAAAGEISYFEKGKFFVSY